MKAFVITIYGHEFSERKAERCIQSAKDVGKINVEKFYAVDKPRAKGVMEGCGLTWTWANDNKSPTVCPISGLKQTPYYNANLNAKIGCSMSHYLLYKRCISLDEPILILEHDAVFIRELPEFDFKGICQINDPKGGGKNGKWLSQQLTKRGGSGVSPKTRNQVGPGVPDGLAGNSAYIIKPHAAQELVDKYHELGVWPNDAIMCIQLFPYLEEYYPFITKIEHEGISTSST